MKCPSCDSELPPDASSCPTCMTSCLESSELAIHLDDGQGKSTRQGRPAAGQLGGTATAEPRFAPGTILAERYRISVSLGRGGMGDVYRADDLKLGQEVALKFLPETMEGDETKLAVLRDEVRLARRITHRNVCRVYDVGEDAGHCFISMEYIDGEHLASLLRRIGLLSRSKALEIAHELCRGLAAAHDQGIVHRDVKPNNIMVDGRGEARITDFGLAVVVESLHDPNAGRGGTPAYMAPEQIRGGELSAKSDLYALGLVLYELFTGRRPFEGRTWMELTRAHLEATPTPPSELVEGLDPAMERGILRCLAKDPDDRPASAHALAEALPGGDASRAGAAAWRPAEGSALPWRPHWEMRRKLGAGGFGEAWLAVHRKTHEERVFKFCHAIEHLSALKREITLFRLLKKELGERDDISRIFDWSFDDPPYYIESEYTHGGNLVTWAEEQGGIAQVPLATRLEIVAQAAEALSAAHSVGVLHKDVKPGNVLIYTEGSLQVRLSDFGIGLLTGDARLSQAGITPVSVTWTAGASGTPLYRPPELLEGKPSTVQADVYALGVMLYQLVVGDLHRALGSGWERDVDDELLRDDIALAVDRSPQRRLGNALRLAERLRSLEERHAERRAEKKAQEEADRARTGLERLRRRLRWTAAVVLAALVGTAITFQARRIGRQLQEARQARQLVRVAVAGDWLAKDPTRAALVLLEIEDTDEVPAAVGELREALGEPFALLELRHGDWVLDAAWNPAGTRVATASGDGTARVWRADGTGSPLELAGHGGPVLALEWSPDGRRLVTASQDTTARVWSLVFGTDGTVTVASSVVLEGHDGWVWDAAWNPDGERVATVSWDRTVRIWSWNEGAASVVLRGHRERVVSAAWSPDGERLVTASWDDTARLWNADGSPSRSGGQAVVLRNPDALWNAAWSPDGEHLVTACWDGAARLWNVDGSPLRHRGQPVVLAGQGGLWTAEWSPDGARLVTASWDGTSRVWNADGTPVRHAADPRSAEGVVVRHGDSVVSAAWSPDSRRIVTTSRDGTARVWNADGSPMQPAGILASRGSSTRALVLRGHGAEVRTAAWSPDGHSVVTASQDGTARVWVLDSLPRLQAHPVESVEAFQPSPVMARSPDGLHVASLGEDGALRLRHADGDELVFPQGEGAAAILALAFSADGQLLLAAAADGTVRRWNADGSGAVAVFGGPSADAEPAVPAGGAALGTARQGILVSAAFDPDAERLLTVSRTGLTEIWSLGAYPEAAPVTVWTPESPVTAAAWRQDGQAAFTRSADGTVREWPLDTASLVAAVRRATKVCLDPGFRERNLGEMPTEAAERSAACARSHGR